MKVDFGGGWRGNINEVLFHKVRSLGLTQLLYPKVPTYICSHENASLGNGSFLRESILYTTVYVSLP